MVSVRWNAAAQTRLKLQHSVDTLKLPPPALTLFYNIQANLGRRPAKHSVALWTQEPRTKIAEDLLENLGLLF